MDNGTNARNAVHDVCANRCNDDAVTRLWIRVENLARKNDEFRRRLESVGLYNAVY